MGEELFSSQAFICHFSTPNIDIIVLIPSLLGIVIATREVIMKSLDENESKKLYAAGIGYVLLAYFFWGLVPLYWKALSHVGSLEVLGHRMVWSAVFLAVISGLRKNWSSVWNTMTTWKTLKPLLVTSILIALNWGTFIWAVSNGYVLETSIGYFLSPMTTVLCGVFILKERLRRLQWVSMGLAGVGILALSIFYGQFPFIAVMLAMTFSLYNLVRKMAGVESQTGLLVETCILLLPAVLYIVAGQGGGKFVEGDSITVALLIGGGIVTSLPLLWLGTALTRVPLRVVGFLQYITPTLQFLLAVFVMKEPFTSIHLISFLFIWSAIGLFTADGLWAQRARRRMGKIQFEIPKETDPSISSDSKKTC